MIAHLFLTQNDAKIVSGSLWGTDFNLSHLFSTSVVMYYIIAWEQE